MIAGLAFVGLAALVLGGAHLLQKRAQAGRSPVVQPAAAPAPAPKPVVWKRLETGDAVLVEVQVTPRSAQARLLLDGAPLPSNPVRLPRGSTHTLGALADGFEPVSQTVRADAATTVRLKLRPSRRR